MTRLVAAELLKLRTTWAFWGFLLATIALVALGVSGQLASRDQTAAEIEPPPGAEVDEAEFFPPPEEAAKQDLLDAIQPTGDIIPLFAVLLGALAFTAEFRYGTISQTFLVTPVRERVLGAKVGAYALAGFALAGVAVGLALAIALPWLSGESDAPLLDRDAVVMIAGVVGASALWGVLGVGLGAIVRHQVLAIVAVLVWLLIVEGLIAGFFDGDFIDYLPGNASRAMGAQPETFVDGAAGELNGPLSRTTATLLTASYAAGSALVAAAVLRRRDVS